MTPWTRIASLGFAFVVADCGGALAQSPVGPRAAPAGLGAPPATTGGALTYDRKGRRDPFEPVEMVDPDMTSPTVASARLKGILRSRTPYVLVETPDGLGYIMKVGDTLGEGRLVEIGSDSVVFSVPARSGATTKRIVLRLPDD